MQLTLTELLWLESKLRLAKSKTATGLLLKTRTELKLTLARMKDSRKDKVPAEDRVLINEYLRTTGVNVCTPAKPQVVKDSMFGLSGEEILMRLGLSAQQEEG